MAYINVENIAPANGPTTGIQKKNLFAVNTSEPYKKEKATIKIENRNKGNIIIPIQQYR